MMKRRMLSLLLALALFLGLAISVSAASMDQVLFDEADLLTDYEEAHLSKTLLDVSQKYNAQIVVVTVSSAEGTTDDYVEFLYDSMGFGYGSNRDGVLLLVCMNPREYRILSNGSAAGAIGGSEIDAMGDAIRPDLSDGNYAAAFDSFAQCCDYYLDGYTNGYPFNFGKNLITCLIIGFVVGLIVALVLKGQLKSVRQQSRAHDYVKEGSMNLTIQRDIFLYRNGTRTKKQSSSSSGSGGGSSRNVGGGSF